MRFLSNHAVETVITNGGIQALSMVNAVVLARWLEPVGRGELAAALLWPMLLVSIGSLGLTDAVLYFASKPNAELSRVLGTSVVLVLAQSVVVMPIGYLLMPLVLGGQSANVVELSRLFLLVVPMSFLTHCVVGIVQGRLALRRFNLIRLLNPGGYVIVTVALHFEGILTPANAVKAQLWLNGLVLVSSLAALRGLTSVLEARFDLESAKALLRFGTQSYLGGMAWQMNTRLDQILLAGWLSPVQLGLYVTAVSASNVLQIIPQAVRMVAAPRIARKVERSLQAEILASSLMMFAFPTVILFGTLALTMPWLLPLIYGDDYRVAIGAAEVLLVAAVFLGAATVMTGGAQAVGLPLLGSKAEGIGLLATLLLLLTLVPAFGIEGAAIASCIAYSVTSLVLFQGLRATLGLSLRNIVSIEFFRTTPLARWLKI